MGICCVCVHMGGVGAAGNFDMLKGAEGQAAVCTALAQALAACSSLQTLNLQFERGKGWEGTWGLKRDAPVSVCLPPHRHRTRVWHCASLCVCVSVCVAECVSCMPITRDLSIFVSTPLFVRPFVSRVNTCVVQGVRAASNSNTNYLLSGLLGLLQVRNVYEDSGSEDEYL